MPRPRKDATLIEETPSQQPEGKEQDAVQITFETADDVPDKEKKSLKEEAKDFVKGLFDTSDTPAPKNKGGRPKSSPGTKKTFQNKVKQVATALIWLLSKTMPSLNEKFIINDGEKDTVYQLLPTQEEAQEIVLPLLRIVDRHTKVTEVNPDLADLVASAWAIGTYAWNTRANLLLLQTIKEMERNEKNNTQQNPTGSNLESRGPNGSIPIDETEAFVFENGS